MSTSIHSNELVSKTILDSVTAAVPLAIRSSSLPPEGSGLFVTADIAAYQEIFRSNPVVCCVDDKSSLFVCDYCYIDSRDPDRRDGQLHESDDTRPDIKACAGCKFVRYCSKDCQKNAWKKYHKHECKAIASSQVSTKTRMMFRLLAMHDNGLLPIEHFEALNALASHTENGPMCPHMNSHCRPHFDTELNDSALEHLFGVVATHCIAIHKCQPLNLGMTVDLATSLISHCCTPNASIFFEGNELRVRTLRPLKAGEEITMHYKRINDDVVIRRDSMKDFAFFTCECEKCHRDLRERHEMFSGDTTRIEQLKQIQEEMMRYNSKIYRLTVIRPETIRRFKAAMDTFARDAFPDGAWPYHLQPMPDMNLTLSMMHKLANHHRSWLLYGIRAVFSLRERYGPEWSQAVWQIAEIVRCTAWERDLDLWYEEGFPRYADFWYMAHGYGNEAALITRDVYGADANFSKALKDEYVQGYTHQRLRDPPGTARYQAQFMVIQSKLLEWAGMEPSVGLVLSGECII